MINLRTLNKKKCLAVFVILGLGLSTDQVSKEVVRQTMPLFSGFDVFGSFFQIVHTENTGAFLSFGATWEPWLRELIFVGLMIPFLGYLLFQALKHDEHIFSVMGSSLLLGGGLGNLVDRIAFGKVTDFLFIDLGFVRTGVFNLADVYIMTGVFMAILGSVLSQKKNQKTDTAPTPDDSSKPI